MTARPFRSHETVPTLGTVVLQELAAEWVHLHASIGPAVLSKWAQQHPCLEGATSLGHLIDELVEQQPRAEQDRVLEALIALAQEGDRLASRVLLQVMLPCLSRMARSFRGGTVGSDHDDRMQHVLGAFCDVVAEFPVGRRTAIAYQLKMATLNTVTRHTRRASQTHDAWNHVDQSERAADHLDSCDSRHPGLSGSASSADETDFGTSGSGSGDELLDLITTALDERLLSPADARFLAEVYLHPHAESRAETAQRLGMTAGALQRRHHRIQTRLRDAVYAATRAA